MTNSADNALSAKRVGQYLIDAGVLKAEQLDEALSRQKRMSKAGFHVLLGTILEEMGAIDRQSLEAVILRQRLDEGSVSLGAEADWTPFRSVPAPEAPAPAGEYKNGHVAPAEPQPSAEPQTPEPVIEPSGFKLEAVSEEPEPANGSATPPDEISYINTESQEAAAPIYGATAPASTMPRSEVEAQGEEATTVESDLSASGYGEPAEFPTQTQTEPAKFEPTPAPVEPRFEPTLAPPTPTYEPPAAPVAEIAPSPSTEPTPNEELASSQVAEASARQTPQPPREILGFTFARTADGGLQENEVVAVVAQLIKRAQALEVQLSEMSESVSHLDSMRRYGEQTIKAADTIADQIRTEAEQQATATRERAQQEARRIIAEGRSRHDHILRQAAETARRLGAEVIKNIEQHRRLNDQLMEVTDAIVNTEPDPGPSGGS
jgi:hypothetical protein